ncbi:AraC family transcriptional regulator [Marinobacter sp. JSM 1782161]|uniref:AraC family transcriptional regulator n=1 Tax=Marinobacter sp. JSM 1782161 TaxID=2685906 RepID=UPI001402FCB0|nr:AraC family transcriptional regulator [Marinobacter sp. JSM 1782161]
MSRTPSQAAVETRWYDADSRFIAAHHQPALLIELAQDRGARSHKLLRHTGLFLDDLYRGQACISPAQSLRLIDNARQMERGQELGFLWGSRLFPGHYGAISTLLQQAGSLADMLAVIRRYQPLLFPWLVPQVVEDERWCYLVWLDPIGTGALRPFLTETAMSAVASVSAWLAGRKLPWRYLFHGKAPAHRAQYDVYFGEHLRFSAAVDVMLIERQWLHQRWRPGSEMITTVARGEADTLLAELGAGRGFLEVVYRHLYQNLSRPLSLEQVAGHFGMSPATFKRKLKHHQCSFQRLLDDARLHASLYLFHIKAWSNEQVADYLNCNDPTNFRRAFKRWTGSTPSDYRGQILTP